MSKEIDELKKFVVILDTNIIAYDSLQWSFTVHNKKGFKIVGNCSVSVMRHSLGTIYSGEWVKPIWQSSTC